MLLTETSTGKLEGKSRRQERKTDRGGVEEAKFGRKTQQEQSLSQNCTHSCRRHFCDHNHCRQLPPLSSSSSRACLGVVSRHRNRKSPRHTLSAKGKSRHIFFLLVVETPDEIIQGGVWDNSSRAWFGKIQEQFPRSREVVASYQPLQISGEKHVSLLNMK